MRIRAAIPVFLILAAVVSAAAAQERRTPGAEEAANRPIEITADRLSADSLRNSVAFDGNVVATQGDVTLSAERLFAEYSRGSGVIEKIVAEGNVLVRQEDKEARAARAVFYNIEQRIVLSGGADLTQAGNTVKGEAVTIYLRENRSTVTGGEGGRVRAVIHPKGGPERKEKQGK
ncbi:MAG TPA: lipopolysaccharide transport periplasmic protein LptA [Candidatus Deferrimicrobiaceae bacterium]|jgi:lipopolysaccharide export system protein LptA